MAQSKPLDGKYTTEVVQKVNAILDKAGLTGEQVGAMENCKNILEAAGLVWRTQVSPDQVGVHPSNRSCVGVSGTEAHAHGQQILKVGFSWQKCSDVMAIEAGRDNEHATMFNTQLVELSGGLIPPLSDLRLLSLGGAHTNTWLRALRAGCASAVPELGDARGCLNAEELSAGKPALQEAIQSGLKWTVLHEQVEQAFPKLIPLFQSALNTHSSGQQSEIEVLLELARLREQCVAQRLARHRHWRVVVGVSPPM